MLFNLYYYFSSSHQPVDQAKRSVHIASVWIDHGCRLGFIVRLAASVPRAVFRRHTCSRICPQRLTSFRMAPRHLKYRTGMEILSTLVITCVSSKTVTRHSDT